MIPTRPRLRDLFAVKTWHIETGVVAAAAIAVANLSGGELADWLAAGGVIAGFGHASISDRLAERDRARTKPSVECVFWLQTHWVAKELLWASFFICTGSWPALLGCAVFAAHPFWRRAYRRWRPLVQESAPPSDPRFVVNIENGAYRAQLLPQGDPDRVEMERTILLTLAARAKARAIARVYANGGRS